MKKINNKGFLLVETMVVATFCVTILVMLFLQFKNIVNIYNNSYKYNTVDGIYSLGVAKKYIAQRNFGTALNLSDTTSYKWIYKYGSANCSNYNTTANKNFCKQMIENANIKNLIYTDESHFSTFLTKLSSTAGLKESGETGFRNFINQLKDKEGNRLIAEFNDGTYASITWVENSG